MKEASQIKTSVDDIEVPNEYLCSITGSIMDDPVVAPDGYTYERKAIEKWLKTNDRSPITNNPLESKALISNRSLRSAIKSFLDKHPHLKLSDDVYLPNKYLEDIIQLIKTQNILEIKKLIQIVPQILTASFKLKSERNILHLVSEFGTSQLLSEIIKLLDEHKVDYLQHILTADKHGLTSAHIAAQRGEATIISQLLTITPKILTQIDRSGNTPLQLAEKHGHIQIAKLLIEKGKAELERLQIEKEKLEKEIISLQKAFGSIISITSQNISIQSDPKIIKKERSTSIVNPLVGQSAIFQHSQNEPPKIALNNSTLKPIIQTLANNPKINNIKIPKKIGTQIEFLAAERSFDSFLKFIPPDMHAVYQDRDHDLDDDASIAIYKLPKKEKICKIQSDFGDLVEIDDKLLVCRLYRKRRNELKKYVELALYNYGGEQLGKKSFCLETLESNKGDYYSAYPRKLKRLEKDFESTFIACEIKNNRLFLTTKNHWYYINDIKNYFNNPLPPRRLTSSGEQDQLIGFVNDDVAIIASFQEVVVYPSKSAKIQHEDYLCHNVVLETYDLKAGKSIEKINFNHLIKPSLKERENPFQISLTKDNTLYILTKSYQFSTEEGFSSKVKEKIGLIINEKGNFISRKKLPEDFQLKFTPFDLSKSLLIQVNNPITFSETDEEPTLYRQPKRDFYFGDKYILRMGLETGIWDVKKERLVYSIDIPKTLKINTYNQEGTIDILNITNQEATFFINSSLQQSLDYPYSKFYGTRGNSHDPRCNPRGYHIVRYKLDSTLVTYELNFRTLLQEGSSIEIKGEQLTLTLTQLKQSSIDQRKKCLTDCADFIHAVIGFQDLAIDVDGKKGKLVFVEKDTEIFREVVELLESLTGQKTQLLNDIEFSRDFKNWKR